MKIASKREIELLCLVWTEAATGREVAQRYREQSSDSLPYGTIYTLLSSMAVRGWVKKSCDCDDHRVRRLVITAAGREALLAARRYHQNLVDLIESVSRAS